ncbi:hypothetical protein WQ59_17045 [Streptomyces sp. KE1]|nr:hypothetical protein WQ59_17045 [Streptomyces sp. KE1]
MRSVRQSSVMGRNYPAALMRGPSRRSREAPTTGQLARTTSRKASRTGERSSGEHPAHLHACAEDQALTPVVQDLMIAEADRAMPARPFTVRTLPGGHRPFAARPAELAAALVA